MYLGELIACEVTPMELVLREIRIDFEAKQRLGEEPERLKAV
jgi:hypothetical protein